MISVAFHTYSSAAHRIVVVERKVLHRDMSGNNILMYPAHNQIVKASAARPFIKPTRPVAFIDDILDGAVYVFLIMVITELLADEPDMQ